MKTGAKEWSDYSHNIQLGCEHNCAYCYAHATAEQYKHLPKGGWQLPELNQTKALYRRRSVGTVMFPTSHDITDYNLPECVIAAKSIVDHGNRLLVVTKAAYHTLRELAGHLMKKKYMVEFRHSITTHNSALAKVWEPGAPSIEERMKALIGMYHAGFETSVSIEPLLDWRPDEVIEMVYPYASTSIWVGLPKMMRSRCALNGGITEDQEDCLTIIEKCHSKEFVKKWMYRYGKDQKVRWKDSVRKRLGRTH